MDVWRNSTDDSDLLHRAVGLNWVRPLGPSPGWRIDREVGSRDAGFQSRREIWSHFRARGRPAAVDTRWHDSLVVRQYLGNDLSKHLFVAGCFEPNEFAFLDALLAPGMTVLDVGAHEGLYTLFASRRVGPTGTIWAFEPSQREFGRLRHNVLRNQLKNVQFFPVALGRQEGAATLHVAEEMQNDRNALGPLPAGVVEAGVEEARVRRLDDVALRYRLERVDVVKLDVEGAEFAVLEGAETVLLNARPVLLLEVNNKELGLRGSSQAKLMQLLRAFAYSTFAFDLGRGLPAPAGANEVSDNIVAAPRESRLAQMLASGGALSRGALGSLNRPAAA